MKTLFSLLALLLLATPVSSVAAQHDEHEAAHEAEHADADHADADHADADHAEGHDAHAEHHSHVITWEMVTADPRLPWTLLTFLILMVGIVMAYRKMGAPALQARARLIEENLAEAQKKKAEAEALREEYKSRLARMGDELEKIRGEMLKAGEAERDRLVAEAESKAASMRRDAEFQIEQKLKQLREDLIKESALTAIAAAKTIITEKANASDQTRLAETYLGALASASSTSSTETRA